MLIAAEYVAALDHDSVTKFLIDIVNKKRKDQAKCTELVSLPWEQGLFTCLLFVAPSIDFYSE
jgi:hypothetical protein